MRVISMMAGVGDSGGFCGLPSVLPEIENKGNS